MNALIGLLFQFGYFDAPPSGPLGPWVARELRFCGLPANHQDYLSGCISAAAFLSLASAFCLLILGAEPAASLLVSASLLPVFFVALAALPHYAKRSRAEEAELELMVLLRVAAIELEQMPFELALADAAGGDGVLSRELRRALLEAERGSRSLPEALSRVPERLDSMAVRRAVSQLCFIYFHGSGFDGLRRQADELLSLRKARLARFASQLSLLGMVFVVASAVVPALFAAYAAVGASLLSFSLPPDQLLFAYALLFPAVDAAILAYIRLKAPKMV